MAHVEESQLWAPKNRSYRVSDVTMAGILNSTMRGTPGGNVSGLCSIRRSRYTACFPALTVAPLLLPQTKTAMRPYCQRKDRQPRYPCSSDQQTVRLH